MYDDYTYLPRLCRDKSTSRLGRINGDFIDWYAYAWATRTGTLSYIFWGPWGIARWRYAIDTSKIYIGSLRYYV